MSSAHLGRHRAAAVSTSPLTTISKAVASNAGSFGRQAAVVTAASALILSVGLPAQAAETQTGRVSAETATVQADVQPVTAAATATVSFASPAVASAPAQAVQPAPLVKAQAATVEAATKTPAPAAPAAAAPAPAAPAPAAPAPAVAVGSGHAGVAAAAYAGIGHPYVYGGTSTSGWDCSGFVQWAYAQAGIKIPRTNQWVGMVQTSNPQPGDLVVQNGGVHVGIYVGNGMVISALNPSQGTLLLPASATGSSVFYTLP